MGNDYFCEFSRDVAREYGIELAIILGFFKKCYSLVQGNESPSYPSVQQCLSVLDFWDENKIRELISELYLKKLI
jgi:hypothetical protein